MSRRPLVLAGAIGLVLLAGLLVLVFGPARGARDDIAAIRGNVHGAHIGITDTLQTQRASLGHLTLQLQALRASLRVQVAALHTARNTAADVHQLLGQARLTEQSTTAILRQAELTLQQLRESRGIQQQLLTVARATLEQTREINHKLP